MVIIVGAVIKGALIHEQLKADGVHMYRGSHVVEYLREHMSSNSTCVYSSHV